MAEEQVADLQAMHEDELADIFPPFSSEEPNVIQLELPMIDDDYDDGEETQDEMTERLRTLFLMRGYKPKSSEPRVPLLQSFDLAGVASLLASGGARNVIVMCGAGISVSAGIPDFRSPGTGLYDNLQKYDLPSPQSIFELSYFREHPEAFYRLARELWPDNFSPTPTHGFIRLLHAKGLLRRCFTQNIDSLEAAAGIPKEKIVAAHGNFDGCSCIETGAAVPVDEMRRAVAVGKEGEGGWAELAVKYGGLCKPDIVFFGEALPERFFRQAEEDFPACDLLIVMGTSLRVHPFASLTGRVASDVPRLLMNREPVGGAEPMLEMLGFQTPGAFDFSRESCYRDALFLGDCDFGVAELARLLGWEDELNAIVQSFSQPPASPAAPPPASPAH
ncbi:hypothetical protein AB1Y20_011612 [Prymnesium parvum]|uniref:Deacetylase sirtuin-type domain-containing protein n=1 Tax=Prymnesium parvum TaxID=97485 RepID=A0AB34IJK2_PRYPA